MVVVLVMVVEEEAVVEVEKCTEEVKMKGSCLCGGIEFEIIDFSGKIYQCHCTLCRKQGGSSSNTGTIVPKSQLNWLSGEKLIKTWTKDTGFTSSFCICCGSLVPNALRKLEYYWVPVGALDNDATHQGIFQIVANLYIDSSAGWALVSPNGARYETMPEVSELLVLLDHQLHS